MKIAKGILRVKGFLNFTLIILFTQFTEWDRLQAVSWNPIVVPSYYKFNYSCIVRIINHSKTQNGTNDVAIIIILK